jgi:drug/metabolite transporter (DMT)-like permease
MPALGLLYAIAAAFFWASAIIVVRLSGAPTILMPIIVASGSFVACLPTLYFVKTGDFQRRAILVALCGALLNGIGMFIGWAKLIGGSSRGQWELSVVMPVTYVLLPTFVVLGSFLIFQERLSTNKSIGLVLTVAGIWFLYRK